MKRPQFVQVVFPVLASLLFATAIANAQKAGDLKIEPYVFESAGGEKVEAELGRLLVPENRLRPQSRLIELAFVRFRSTSKNPSSPIIYLAGGPGGSGTATARGTRFPLFTALREVADVIALDQRRVGQSEPNLYCLDPVDYPADKAPDRQELLDSFRKISRTCAERFRKDGVDLEGYNTKESADDLEDLRKALGAKRICLWAISYGTHLSLATIERHESSIDRMILAGVEGLTQTIKLPSNIQRHPHPSNSDRPVFWRRRSLAAGVFLCDVEGRFLGRRAGLDGLHQRRAFPPWLGHGLHDGLLFGTIRRSPPADRRGSQNLPARRHH